MAAIAGTKSSLTWAVQLSTLALVLLWIFPTVGLLVSSFRTVDQINSSGWWASLTAAEQNVVFRTADPDENRVAGGADGTTFLVAGNVFDDEASGATIGAWGVSSRAIDTYQAGDTADLGDGETITVDAEGNYAWSGNDEQISGRGQRIFATITAPPDFTLDNYEQVLLSATAPTPWPKRSSTR